MRTVVIEIVASLNFNRYHFPSPVYYVLVLAVMLGGGLPLVRRSNLKQIVMRKYFHLVAMVLFVPTILIHIRFMSLAFAVAFAVLLVRI
jgi:dolichol kinase